MVGSVFAAVLVIPILVLSVKIHWILEAKQI
jgi:hypothetical protein